MIATFPMRIRQCGNSKKGISTSVVVKEHKRALLSVLRTRQQSTRAHKCPRTQSLGEWFNRNH